jgi:hypothetical protein
MKKLLIVDVIDNKPCTVLIPNQGVFVKGSQYFEIWDGFTPSEIDYLLTLHRMNENGKHFAPVQDGLNEKLKQLR